MSFLDDLFDLGKSALGFLTGNSTGSSLARTALLGLAINKLSESAIKDTERKSGVTTTTAPDTGVRIQVRPDVNNKIPVLYGTGFVPGIISDAEMSADRQTMYYVITISERTGTKLSDNQPSAYTFLDVYRNDQRIVFKTNDSCTVDYAIDRDGNVDTSLRDLVKIRVYGGNSLSPMTPQNYSATVTTTAYDAVPSWTSSHAMTNLIFAVVEVRYARDKNSNDLGNLVFHIRNTMTRPGDCIYDYMTNTRYGAGIPAAEIFDE